MQDAVFEAAEAHGEEVEEVVLADEPWAFGGLLRQGRRGPLDVAGVEIKEGSRFERVRIADGFADAIVFAIHSIQQTTDKDRD